MRDITDKQALRKTFKAQRSQMPSDEKKALDKAVFENISGFEIFKNSRSVLSYVSGIIEVDTIALIKNALGAKKVYCPRCVKGTSLMDFYRIESLDDLERGSFDIFEPKSHCLPYVQEDRAVCIVPALSIDKEGYRLGFGKGFYDRYLADFKGVKIGLCYSSFLSDSLPHDNYDIRLDHIVTERGIITVKKG